MPPKTDIDTSASLAHWQAASATTDALKAQFPASLARKNATAAARTATNKRIGDALLGRYQAGIHGRDPTIDADIVNLTADNAAKNDAAAAHTRLVKDISSADSTEVTLARAHALALKGLSK